MLRREDGEDTNRVESRLSEYGLLWSDTQDGFTGIGGIEVVLIVKEPTHLTTVHGTSGTNSICLCSV